MAAPAKASRTAALSRGLAAEQPGIASRKLGPRHDLTRCRAPVARSVRRSGDCLMPEETWLPEGDLA